jgi:hypothetical protein
MSGPNPINITPDNNEITLQDVNRIITIVDNNSGTTVNVTQPNVSVIRIYDGGLQGPAGSTGTTVNTGSLVTTSSFNSFTSSINNFTSSYSTGSFTGSFTGSVLGTASWATNALTASFAPDYVLNSSTGSFTTTSSFNSFTASINSFTSSYNTGSFTGSFTGSLLGTASFVSDPDITRDLYYLTASVNIGNTITGAPTTASVGQFSLPAGTPSGSMITINGFFSSTSNSNTKTVIFLVNDNASTISLATYTGGLQFILSGRVVNSTTIRFFRVGGTINISTAPSFVDIASIGGVWSLKTSTTVNTGAGAGITNTLEALTVRL